MLASCCASQSVLGFAVTTVGAAVSEARLRGAEAFFPPPMPISAAVIGSACWFACILSAASAFASARLALSLMCASAAMPALMAPVR